MYYNCIFYKVSFSTPPQATGLSNWLWHSDTIRHRITWLTLVQVTVSCLYGAKLLFKPMLTYYGLDKLITDFSEIYIKNKHFSQEIAFDFVFCKMMTICSGTKTFFLVAILAVFHWYVNAWLLWVFDTCYNYHGGITCWAPGISVTRWCGLGTLLVKWHGHYGEFARMSDVSDTWFLRTICSRMSGVMWYWSGYYMLTISMIICLKPASH